jgi:AcrR family transcriptional regulator
VSSESATIRPSLRDEQKQLTRRRLIDGAVSVFEAKGYADATVEEIVAAAGVSRATFYLHFASKLELAEAWFETLRPELEERYRRLDAVLETGSADELRGWMHESVRWSRRHSSYANVLQQIFATEHSDPRFADVEFPYVEHMPAYRARWPESRRTEAALRIWMMFMLYLQVLQLWGPDRLMRQADMELVVDTLTDVWSKALAP